MVFKHVGIEPSVYTSCRVLGRVLYTSKGRRGGIWGVEEMWVGRKKGDEWREPSRGGPWPEPREGRHSSVHPWPMEAFVTADELDSCTSARHHQDAAVIPPHGPRSLFTWVTPMDLASLHQAVACSRKASQVAEQGPFLCAPITPVPLS